MQKREKIILTLVVIAAIYAAVDFTLTSQKKKAQQSDTAPIGVSLPGPTSAELDALLAPNNTKIDRIAASLNDPWPDQVFAARPIEFDGEQKTDTSREQHLSELKGKVSQFYYTGFVAMNDDRIAIINGMDYRVGEQIEGFTISKITMEAVQVTASEASFDIPAAVDLPPAEQSQE